MVDTAGPAAERCRLDVRAKRMRRMQRFEDFVATASSTMRRARSAFVVPIYHLFIVYTDALGDEYYYRGGPAREGPPYGRVVTRHGPYVEDTIDWDPEAVSATLAQGAAAAGLDVCLQSTLEHIESLGIAYTPLGPNSNTVVRALLEQCGLPVAQPVSMAPGFDYSGLFRG